MNFIDFLKSNSVVSFNTSPTQNSSTKKQTKHTDKSTNVKINKENNKDIKKTSTTIKEQNNYTTTTPQQNLHPLQKGDIVKIIKYQNSIYNYYKGYIGEIKEYNPYKNYVTVFLHSIYHFKLLQLHTDHVVKI